MKGSGLLMLFFLIVPFFLVIGVSHASSVSSSATYNPISQNNTVILATGINSVDTFSAYPIANLYGVPILSLNSTEMSYSLAQNLSASGIKNVIVLGGPAVIANSTISTLRSAGLSVIRVWGVTAPQTALDINQYFAPRPIFNCTAFAFYNESPQFDYPFQFAAAAYAAANKCMVFPVYFSVIPYYVLKYLSSNNISNATYFGPSDLPASAVSNFTTFKSFVGNSSYMSQVVSAIRSARPSRMLIVGSSENTWRAALNLGSLPSVNSSFAMVTNVSTQMPGIIDVIRTYSIQEVDVVGVPSVVSAIDLYLSAQNITFSSYSEVGEAQSSAVLNRFRGDVSSINCNVCGPKDAASSAVGGLIGSALQKLSDYNNTLNSLPKNNTNLSVLRSAINATYGMLQRASADLSSGNVSGAMSQLQLANSFLQQNLYDYLKETIVSQQIESSFNNPFLSVSDGQQLLGKISSLLSKQTANGLNVSFFTHNTINIGSLPGNSTDYYTDLAFYGKSYKLSLSIPLSLLKNLQQAQASGGFSNISAALTSKSLNEIVVYNGTRVLTCSNAKPGLPLYKDTFNSTEYCAYSGSNAAQETLSPGALSFLASNIPLSLLASNISSTFLLTSSGVPLNYTPVSLEGTETAGGHVCSLLALNENSTRASLCISNTFGVPMLASGKDSFRQKSSPSTTITGFSGASVSSASCAANNSLNLSISDEQGVSINITGLTVNGMPEKLQDNVHLAPGGSQAVFMPGGCSNNVHLFQVTINYTEVNSFGTIRYSSSGSISVIQASQPTDFIISWNSTASIEQNPTQGTVISLPPSVIFSNSTSAATPTPVSSSTGFSPFTVNSSYCNSTGLYLYLINSIGSTASIINITSSSSTGIIANATQPAFNKITLSPNAGAQLKIGAATCNAGVKYSTLLDITYTEPGQSFPGPYTSSGRIAGTSS